jgi:hypothetical protein
MGIPTQVTCPPRKGGVLRTQSAGGLRPTVRLGLCLVLGVAPLLLLATPGRASPRSTGVRYDTAGTVARARRRAPALATDAPTRRTVRVAVAAERSPTERSTTTTTTTSTTTATTARTPSTTTTAESTAVTTTTTPAVAVPMATVRLIAVSPPTTTTTTTTTSMPPRRHVETGEASWYSSRPGYCASPYLSFGTVVTVTDLSTGATIQCTVDDRQAQNPGRVVDLSYDGFSNLAYPSIGLVEVRLSW